MEEEPKGPKGEKREERVDYHVLEQTKLRFQVQWTRDEWDPIRGIISYLEDFSRAKLWQQQRMENEIREKKKKKSSKKTKTKYNVDSKEETGEQSSSSSMTKKKEHHE